MNYLKRFHEKKKRGPKPHSLYLDHIVRKAVAAHYRRDQHLRAHKDIYVIKVLHTTICPYPCLLPNIIKQGTAHYPSVPTCVSYPTSLNKVLHTTIFLYLCLLPNIIIQGTAHYPSVPTRVSYPTSLNKVLHTIPLSLPVSLTQRH